MNIYVALLIELCKLRRLGRNTENTNFAIGPSVVPRCLIDTCPEAIASTPGAEREAERCEPRPTGPSCGRVRRRCHGLRTVRASVRAGERKRERYVLRYVGLIRARAVSTVVAASRCRLAHRCVGRDELVRPGETSRGPCWSAARSGLRCSRAFDDSGVDE